MTNFNKPMKKKFFQNNEEQIKKKARCHKYSIRMQVFNMTIAVF